MSKYTTGEIAKLCGVSVRTVQYYDTRGILAPSGLSGGGRRLYSENDFKRMKIICFLRGAGIPINSIKELLSEDDPGSVVSALSSEYPACTQDKPCIPDSPSISSAITTPSFCPSFPSYSSISP